MLAIHSAMRPMPVLSTRCFARRRHGMGLAGHADSFEKDRAGPIPGHHDLGFGLAERVVDQAVDDAALVESRLVAGIPKGMDTAGPVAMGAVGIRVAAGPCFHRYHPDRPRRRAGPCRSDPLPWAHFEEADRGQGMELVVGHAGGCVTEGTIQLPRVHPEHAAARMGVAGQAILTPGKNQFCCLSGLPFSPLATTKLAL